MTREEATELLPVIQAFSEGRIIEFSSITDVSKAWREVTDFPVGMIKNLKVSYIKNDDLQVTLAPVAEVEENLP